MSFVDVVPRLRAAGERETLGRFAIEFKHFEDGRWQPAPTESFVASNGGATLAVLPSAGDVVLAATRAEDNPLHRDGTFLWFYGDPITELVDGGMRTFSLVGMLMAWSSAEERSSPALWFVESETGGRSRRGNLGFKERGLRCQWKGTTSITRACSRFVSKQDSDSNDVAFSIDMSLRFGN